MPGYLKRSLRQAWYRLPESRVKDFVRMRGSLSVLTPQSHPMLIELNQLALVDAGTTPEGLRYLQLNDGPVFFGFGVSGNHSATCTYSYLHKSLHEEVRDVLPREFIDIACDIVCRYKYPHADPTLDLPYSDRDRGTFHPQHRDTIQDVPGISDEQKRSLRDRFKINPGDVVFDVGSYIGYGAMRLSELVGPDGLIVSVEADCRNQELFGKNILENKLSNVQLIPRAIWRDRGLQPLFWNDSQLNSLVEGIVAEKQSRLTETDSVDDIVADLGLDKVSLISLTVNGAEIEALLGMEKTLRELGPRLSIAGWYERSGEPVYEEVVKLLKKNGYQTQVGRLGRVYGWVE